MLKRKAKIFARAAGFRGRRSNCWAIAVRAVHRAWQAGYIGRKLRKRSYRSLWIQNINAGARLHGTTYSALLRALPAGGFALNRKVLADLAASEPLSFAAVCAAVKHVAPPQVQPQLR